MQQERAVLSRIERRKSKKSYQGGQSEINTRETIPTTTRKPNGKDETRRDETKEEATVHGIVLTKGECCDFDYDGTGNEQEATSVGVGRRRDRSGWLVILVGA